MKNKYKDWIQYGSAMFLIVAGVGLCYYARMATGSINGNDLGFTGECFTLAGSIFGLAGYVRTKLKDGFDSLKEYIDSEKSK